MAENQLQNFYRKKNILITGGTGFIGQLLVEKFLRSCDGIDKIYLVIRDKKGQTASQRIDEYFNKEIFDVLKSKNSNFRNKVIGVSGEITKSLLGLSNEDQECLKENVNVVFHVAATTSFTDPIKVAININLVASKEVLMFSKTIKNLDSFIYVSTAYSNCPWDHIEEAVYSYPNILTWESMIKLLDIFDDKQLEAVTPILLQNWPNTYCFSKALAERMLQETHENVSVGIFRPGIVISTAYEPKEGWADNFQSPTGVIAALYAGLLKTIQINNTSNCNLVPADMCANAIIASAWDVNKRSASQPMKSPTVYNFALSDNLFSWGDLIQSALFLHKKYPVTMALWYPFLIPTKCSKFGNTMKILLHLIPAYIYQGLFKLTGCRMKIMNQYTRLKKQISVIEYFSTGNWSFETKNLYEMWNEMSLDEKQIFRFNLKELEWHKYMDNYIRGMRQYLFKEDLSTVPQAQKWAQFLLNAHRVFMSIIVLFFGSLVYFIFKLFF